MSNFQKRVLSSVVGGGLVIAFIIIGREALLGLLLAVSIIGFFELTKAVGIHEADKKVNALEVVGIIATVIWYIVMEFTHADNRLVLSAGFLIVILELLMYMVVYVITFPRFKADQVMSAMFSFIYCPVMISFIYLTRELDYGLYLVWMVFVCSWFCDIFAYLVGVKFGKHKFVPRLSPKKSTEGVFGGLAGAALIGGLYSGIVLTKQITAKSPAQVVIVIIVISVLGAAFSMFGDLAASAIKRNHEIKDYGNLIPGHGGIMDRFDSVIFVAPVVYALSLLFLQYINR